MNDYIRPLFIFEMANNHQGSVEHGIRIIREIRKVCDQFTQFDFAFKLQYRDLDTFIQKDYKERTDIKNVKRFLETRLTQQQFDKLLSEIRQNQFLAVCTPFDEISAERIAQQEYDFIKIASASFDDWPLLEKIAEKKVPVIASAAGSSIMQISNVVCFFQNRNIDFSLMHCIAEYPTPLGHLQMNQIDYYKSMFPDLRIGFSTHEDPDHMLPVTLAIAKGARIFEKHVGVPMESAALNAYSAEPKQVYRWLETAALAFEACGTKGVRYEPVQKEMEDLAALKRGVFVKKDICRDQILSREDIYLAFPCVPGQLTAGDLSKYSQICLLTDILKKDMPVMKADVRVWNYSKEVFEIVKKLTALLTESSVVIPAGSTCEISHHYGIKNYYKTGVAMLDCINREYCKKILVLLPGQSHPKHYHVKKEETFVILHGDLNMMLNGEQKLLHKGDLMTVERNVPHSFSSQAGCIFEEISTTHFQNDSFYEDDQKFVNPRKTRIYFTKERLSYINGSDS